MPWYWERHPEGPFATLIAVATTYLDPEIYNLDSLNMLKALARRQGDEKMRVFKSELSEAIRDRASYRKASICIGVSRMTTAWPMRHSGGGSGASCTATSRDRQQR